MIKVNLPIRAAESLEMLLKANIAALNDKAANEEKDFTHGQEGHRTNPNFAIGYRAAASALADLKSLVVV